MRVETWKFIVIIYFIFMFLFLLLLLYNYKKKNPIKQISYETIKLNEKYECAICLDYINENNYIYKLDCNHKYHKKCLNRWIKEKQKCPLCLNKIILV